MLLNCTFYADEWAHDLITILSKHKKYMFTCISDSTEGCVHIMRCEDETAAVSFHLEKFIHKCFSIRMAS